MCQISHPEWCNHQWLPEFVSKVCGVSSHSVVFSYRPQYTRDTSHMWKDALPIGKAAKRLAITQFLNQRKWFEYYPKLSPIANKGTCHMKSYKPLLKISMRMIWRLSLMSTFRCLEIRHLRSGQITVVDPNTGRLLRLLMWLAKFALICCQQSCKCAKSH